MKITFILGGFLGFIAHLTFLELSCPLKPEPLTKGTNVTWNLHMPKYRCRKCGRVTAFSGLAFYVEGRKKAYCASCIGNLLDQYTGILDEEKN